MSVKGILVERQKELAREFARLILHDGKTAEAVALEYDMPSHSVRYLMRKHGFPSIRASRTTTRARVLEVGRHSLDDLIQMRRLGKSYDDIAAETDYEGNGEALLRLLKYHCQKNGLGWPIKVVTD